MKYLLLMYANESEAPQTQEELQALQPAWFAYMQAAQAAGALLSNGGAAPGANATTVLNLRTKARLPFYLSLVHTVRSHK